MMIGTGLRLYNEVLRIFKGMESSDQLIRVDSIYMKRCGMSIQLVAETRNRSNIQTTGSREHPVGTDH